MPFIAALGGLLLRLVGPLTLRVLLALGISFVTFKGFDVAVDLLLSDIKSDLGSMPSDVVSFLGWLWVDKAIGMVFSCFSACMAVRALGGSGITKMVMKGGGS